MKTFYVLWTYVANYSRLFKIDARDKEEALAASTGYYGVDFKTKGSVFVFDTPPVTIQYRGRVMSYEEYLEASKADR